MVGFLTEDGPTELRGAGGNDGASGLSGSAFPDANWQASVSVRLSDVSIGAFTEPLKAARALQFKEFPRRLLVPDQKAGEGHFILSGEAVMELNRQLVDQLCRVSHNFDTIRDELQARLFPIYEKLSELSAGIITSGTSGVAKNHAHYREILVELTGCFSRLYQLEKHNLQLLESNSELFGGREFSEILLEARGIAIQVMTSPDRPDIQRYDGDEPQDDETTPSPVDGKGEGNFDNGDEELLVFHKMAQSILRWPVAVWPGQQLFNPHEAMRTLLDECVVRVCPEVGDLMGALVALDDSASPAVKILDHEVGNIFQSANRLFALCRSLHLKYSQTAPTLGTYGYVPQHRREEIRMGRLEEGE